MKRVYKSKNPSVQQMLNMTSNLTEKFGKSSAIEVNAWQFAHKDDNKARYRIYVEDNVSIDFDFWFELQAYYFGLMGDVTS